MVPFQELEEFVLEMLFCFNIFYNQRGTLLQTNSKSNSGIKKQFSLGGNYGGQLLQCPLQAVSNLNLDEVAQDYI